MAHCSRARLLRKQHRVRIRASPHNDPDVLQEDHCDLFQREQIYKKHHQINLLQRYIVYTIIEDSLLTISLHLYY